MAALERERLRQRETLVAALAGERYPSALDPLRRGARRVAVSATRASRWSGSPTARSSGSAPPTRELGEPPGDDELHAVRIRAKHARYAAELAALGEGDPLATLADALRAVQDLIGAHQDAVVAELRVRALATDESRLAAGRIVELGRARRRRPPAPTCRPPSDASSGRPRRRSRAALSRRRSPAPDLRPSRPAATCSRRSGQRRVARLAEPALEHLHDRDAGVEPDQVGERERAERVAEAEPGDGVDRLGLGDPGRERVDRLVDERHQDPVGDEAGDVARLDRLLAEVAGERRHGRGRRRRGRRGRGSPRRA